MFLTILEKNAPIEKKLVSNIKKTTSEKPWVTKEIQHLVAEKHRYFSDYETPENGPYALLAIFLVLLFLSVLIKCVSALLIL